MAAHGWCKMESADATAEGAQHSPPPGSAPGRRKSRFSRTRMPPIFPPAVEPKQRSHALGIVLTILFSYLYVPLWLAMTMRELPRLKQKELNPWVVATLLWASFIVFIVFLVRGALYYRRDFPIVAFLAMLSYLIIMGISMRNISRRIQSAALRLHVPVNITSYSIGFLSSALFGRFLSIFDLVALVFLIIWWVKAQTLANTLASHWATYGSYELQTPRSDQPYGNAPVMQ